MTQKIWSVSFRESIQSITWPKKEVVLQEVVDKRKTVNEKNVSKAISFLGGLSVKSDLRGGLLDTTLIDVTWAKQTP